MLHTHCPERLWCCSLLAWRVCTVLLLVAMMVLHCVAAGVVMLCCVLRGAAGRMDACCCGASRRQGLMLRGGGVMRVGCVDRGTSTAERSCEVWPRTAAVNVLLLDCSWWEAGELVFSW